MGTWLDFLTSSHTVAKFQTLFGVEIIETAEANGSVGGADHEDLAVNGGTKSSNRWSNKYSQDTIKSRINGNRNYQEIKQNSGNGILRTRPESNGVEKSASSTSDGDPSDSDQLTSARTSQNGHVKNSKVTHKIHNKMWYYIFLFGASLGNETFFITFLPFCCWHFSLIMTRQLIVMWCLVMYLGQGAKDIVKWPRPSSPPVVKLEHLYDKEFGMPSTHAMMGLSLPVTLFYITKDRYEYPYILGVIMVVLWCTIVCGSRLYLGMHSVLDIIVGLVYSAAIVVVVAPYLSMMDEFFCWHDYGAITALIIGISMCVCYPTLDRWSAARGDATLILGVATGAQIGMWAKNHYNILPLDPVEPPPYQIPSPDLYMIGLIILKSAIGIPILLLTRLVMKPTIYAVVCFILGIPYAEAKATERVVIELPKKFFTYMAVVLNACLTVPALYVYLGLQ